MAASLGYNLAPVAVRKSKRRVFLSTFKEEV